MRKLLTCLLLVTNCFASERIHLPWSLEGADARIREYRMGAETFQIELPNGEPLPKGVVCSVTQVKHAFNFGESASRKVNNSQAPPTVVPHLRCPLQCACVSGYQLPRNQPHYQGSVGSVP